MSSLATPCRHCNETVGPFIETTPGETRVFDHPFMWRCPKCGAYGDDSLRVMIVPEGKKPQRDESGRTRMVDHYARVEY